jgi:hypothetical protein
MYKNWDAALGRILELVAKCPKEYQEKCFEVLLSGYVQLEIGFVNPQAASTTTIQRNKQHPPPDPDIPAALLLRFKNTAKRLNIETEKLTSLFDFSVDPFTLQAVSISGKNTAEKSRNVALLAAARSYFATGSWTADWQEVKAMCVNHNCYDKKNFAINLKQGAGGWFKTFEPGKTIELSASGIKAAEKLLKDLIAGAEE